MLAISVSYRRPSMERFLYRKDIFIITEKQLRIGRHHRSFLAFYYNYYFLFFFFSASRSFFNSKFHLQRLFFSPSAVVVGRGGGLTSNIFVTRPRKDGNRRKRLEVEEVKKEKRSAI